jgi:hypothetical protein
MKKFFLATAIIITGLVALVATLRSLALRAPLPPEIEILHLDECVLPCWIGIKPGETTVEEAKALIKLRYGNLTRVDQAGYETYTVSAKSSDYKFSVAFYYETDPDPILKFVSIRLDDSMPTIELGDLFWLLGDPDLVTPSMIITPPDHTLLYRHNTHTLAGLEADHCGGGDKVSIHQRVTHLTMWDNTIEENGSLDNDIAWRGFIGACYGQ